MPKGKRRSILELDGLMDILPLNEYRQAREVLAVRPIWLVSVINRLEISSNISMETLQCTELTQHSS